MAFLGDDELIMVQAIPGCTVASFKLISESAAAPKDPLRWSHFGCTVAEMDADMHKIDVSPLDPVQELQISAASTHHRQYEVH
jgi:hypothetical protein